MKMPPSIACGQPDDAVRLNELDADELFDVARHINPAYTREQFTEDFAEFVRLKTARLRATGIPNRSSSDPD